MLKYIIFLIIFIISLFGLYWLALKFMDKYGASLADKYGKKSDKKSFFVNINNTCLIIAFLLFFPVVMPNINRILFTTMAAAFVLRSVRGYMSVFRGIWLLIGSFSIGVVLSRLGTYMLDPVVTAVLLAVGIPMLILGMQKSSSDSIKKDGREEN